ncbi:hypothetical protein SHI21_05505 [Bacteriovorax sp. PP10]|uniref:Uncharacterized protein n=1 Tax=Bacteriovorax antarcticus TaxID=3088717 RepID=A0ABU5VRG6_9BACT|nr:hypothetical protein [Bacteriovorax sp. PP10]MEA9355642.1 hypothetical protein [Bacteriovorax sp. PP10]
MTLSRIGLSLFLATMMATPSFAKTQECLGDTVVASFICTTPFAPDIRFYMNEFQTCENGQIIELNRSMSGMNVVSNEDIDEIHTIDAENISVTYAEKRTLIDPVNRVDYLSFLMPTSMVMMDGDSVIEMKVTDVIEPDYEGSDQTHFIGSYKMMNKDHPSEEGKLICFVYR